MVSLWVIIGLVVAATAVSIFGAVFSILGLAALFSGAVKAVFGMAASLEFAKFVLAAYLHQRWKFLNLVFKSYLTSAVVILSLITSMGVFGFLSDAYSSASHELETETVKLTNLQNEKGRVSIELARLTKSIEEIPANRITKRMQARQEFEPAMKVLNDDLAAIEKKIGEANLQILKVKQKVGPLLYISKAFNMNIDDVVKYLILLFVIVFDPLAICLVIATSEALQSRSSKKGELTDTPSRQPDSGATVTPLREADPNEVITMSFSDADDQAQMGPDKKDEVA